MKWMLVVLVWANAGLATPQEFRYDVDEAETCKFMLKTMQHEIAIGGDSEGGFVAFCAPYDERGAQINYDFKYRRTPEKE